MLRGGGLWVCQVRAALGLAPSTVSAHLSELKRAGLVVEQRDGRWVRYSLANDPSATALLETLFTLVEGDERIRADAQLARRLRAVPVEKLCRVDRGGARLSTVRVAEQRERNA